MASLCNCNEKPGWNEKRDKTVLHKLEKPSVFTTREAARRLETSCLSQHNYGGRIEILR